MATDHKSRVIGIDVGSAFGSGIRGALVDEGAALIARKQAITPRTDESELIGAIVTMAGRLADLARQDGPPPSALGVAVPGLVDEASGIVHRSPNLVWREVNLRHILEERVGLPVCLVQDARAGAIAESTLGVGRGVSDMLLVVMGAGVGSAVISGGRALRGAHGTAGEIGHVSADPTGLTCGCGGRGCVETLASEPSLARRYTMAAQEAIPANEVIRRAVAGDPGAAGVWNDALAALATVIATAVAVIDCELVVLSGTMTIPTAALTPLRDLIAKRINLVRPPRLEVGALGDAAGILGAAAAAFEGAGMGGFTRELREAGEHRVGAA